MNYQFEIAIQEGVINQLNSQIKQTKHPARTIDWQHNNIGSTQGVTQRILVLKRERKKLNTRVDTAKRNIMSLRESLLGVE